jgi:hypothetical protein
MSNPSVLLPRNLFHPPQIKVVVELRQTAGSGGCADVLAGSRIGGATTRCSPRAKQASMAKDRLDTQIVAELKVLAVAGDPASSNIRVAACVS